MADTPTIKPAPNGPLLVTGCAKLVNAHDGAQHDAEGTVALCRCGDSKNKPFCDGSHRKNGFSDAKEDDRVPDQDEVHTADGGVEVRDNRGICAHAGYCTEGLPAVFRRKEEPFVDASGAPGEEIAKIVNACPSGAIRMTIAGANAGPAGEECQIVVVPNGPYGVRGGATLEEAALGDGMDGVRLTLCRCGKSKNKPFCNGAHWYHQFDEHAPKPDA
jgi:CDGSH-type Zn-finger protein